ncbi:hypothetical protein [Saccharicrinis aurantiacus]|uniref:hypothetical protein n=1 Tax=Saccharicrinis aurantiacus TaxID=1849719 RepID=UPI0024934329|nr:hypothetical protein [Saccharicrinis aurantiacus]
MKQLILALIIHIAVGISFIYNPDYLVLAYVVGVVALFNILGILSIAIGNTVIGARIFFISSLILVPIGLIGALGARKILEEERKKAFYD